MLTVKHITKIDESVREATQAWMVRSTPEKQCHVVSCLDGGKELLDGGTVYVMNESGQTVAKYDLDAYAAGP